jgi:hypothetical protein
MSTTTNHTGVLLALDQATNTGWAVGQIGQPFVTTPMEIAAGGLNAGLLGSGTARTTSTDAMRGWLGMMISEHKVRGIIYESPIHAGGKTSFKTARLLYALAETIEDVARKRVLWCAENGRSSAYKAVVGKGNATKEEARDHLRALGFDPQTLDESDAIIHWHAAALQLREKGW